MKRFAGLAFSLILLFSISQVDAKIAERAIAYGGAGSHDHSGTTSGTNIDSEDVTYDNSTSGLTATDVKIAIDELETEKIPGTEKGALNGVATLDGTGKVSSSQIPAYAIGTFDTCANEICQLALTTDEGDVCERSDEGKTYINNGGTAGTMADWNEIEAIGVVMSVNSQVGIITGLEDQSNKQTSITDDDGKYPSSGGVVDYVAAALADPSLDSVDIGSGTDKLHVGTMTDGSVYWGFNCTESAGTWTAQDAAKDAYAYVYSDTDGVLHMYTKDDTSSPWLTAAWDSDSNLSKAGTYTSALGMNSERNGSGLNVLTGKNTALGSPTVLALDTTPALRMGPGGAFDTVVERSGIAEVTITNDLIINDDLTVDNIDAKAGAQFHSSSYNSGNSSEILSTLTNSGTDVLAGFNINCYWNGATEKFVARDTGEKAICLMYTEQDDRVILCVKHTGMATPWSYSAWDVKQVIADMSADDSFRPNQVRMFGAAGSDEIVVYNSAASTYPSVVVNGDGSIDFSAGGTDVDNTFSRLDAETLQVSNDFKIVGDDLLLGADTSLSRSGADVISTSDSFSALSFTAQGASGTTIIAQDATAASGDAAIYLDLNSEAYARWLVQYDGTTEFGPGSGARDIRVSRTGAETLMISDASNAQLTELQLNAIVTFGGGSVSLAEISTNVLGIGTGDKFAADDASQYSFTSDTKYKVYNIADVTVSPDQSTYVQKGSGYFGVASVANTTYKYGYTPVHLPHGVSVTTVTSYGYTAASTDDAINNVLYKQGLASGTNTALATTFFTNGGTSASDSSVGANPEVIDLTAYSYFVENAIKSETDINNAKFYSTVITYTITDMSMTQ